MRHCVCRSTPDLSIGSDKQTNTKNYLNDRLASSSMVGRSVEMPMEDGGMDGWIGPLCL